MCTYNGEKYVEEQIDSIINQTYPIYEIIIQDDVSSDGTFGILKEYEKRYPFIRVFQNEERQGISKNFFSAMSRATGDYIAISDQDDRWKPDKIERQAPYVDDFLLVAGGSAFFAGDDEAKVSCDDRPANTHLERLIYNTIILGHTMLFRKTLIDQIPDVDLWSSYFMYDHLIAIVAAAHRSIKYIPQVLVDHRRLLGSATYIEPLNFERTFGNMLRIAFRTFGQYRKLRPQMQTYFSRIYSLLESVRAPMETKEDAMKYALYQSQKTVSAYLRLTFLCVKLRDKIFYAPERNRMLAVLRAFYFPISSSDYFRYLL
jgi:glycosyltransferase involved in cell wall biosynthesis